MKTWYWSYVIGYGFAVIGGHVATKLVVQKAWKAVGWRGTEDRAIRPDAWQPETVGILERLLYVAALQFAHAEFVGLWLAIKTAGQWKRWNEETQIPGRHSISGRSVYQNFLIGNAVSILYSFVGFKLIDWISKQQWLLSYLVAASVLLLTGILWIRIPAGVQQPTTEKANRVRASG